MKRLICSLLIVTVTFVGCAGTDPNLIATYIPGDENKSCAALKAEIANIDKQITRKYLSIWPAWFFMDLKDNEKAEINALEQRKDALLVIAADKNCDF